MMGRRWTAVVLALASLSALAAATTPGARKIAQARKLLAQLKLVDGAGSGLDADLLEGKSADSFAGASHTHPDLEDRTRCMRVVNDVTIFDGCS